MTIYWIDPYLGATSQCDGTTDTTTKSGTYAAPWAWTDCLSTSSSNLTTINGTTLADGDEIRIKGLPFSTMFTLGNSSAYCSGTSLYPNSGFGTGDLAEFQATGVVAFDPTQMQEFTGPCEDDYLFMSYYFGNATSSKSNYDNRGLHELLYSKYGPSNKTMKLYYFDSNYYDNTSYQLDGNRYFLNHNNTSNDFTISAGWTSETAQGGITLIPVIWSTNYRSLYFGYTTSVNTYDWKVNCEHLYFVHQNTSKDSSRAYFYFCGGREIESPRRYQKLGGSTSSYGNTVGTIGYSSSDMQVDKCVGYNLLVYQRSYQSDSDVILNFGTMGYITGPLLACSYTANNYTVTAKFGTIGVDTYQDYDDSTAIFTESNNFVNLDSLTIKDNAVLSVSSSTYTSYIQWQMFDESGGNTRPLIFGSNIRSTSDPNVTGINNVHSLKAYGGSLGTSWLNIAQGNMGYTSSNWYDDIVLYDSTKFTPFAIPEQSHGVLEMSSTNYRTSDNSINVVGTPDIRTFYPTSSTDTIRGVAAPLIVFETNDYDGIPIALVPAQTLTGGIPPALLYNDSSNSDILTLQAPTWTTTSSYNFAVPFKVSIPDYTQGSSTITVSVDLSVTSGLTSSSNVQLWGAYRDSAATNNVGLDSNSTTAASSLSSSDSSPTTITLILSPPSSGQEKINSAVVFVSLNVANTNKGYNSKLKIHDVSVSVS